MNAALMRLCKGVAMLPEDFRAAAVLRDVEGLTNAEALDINVSSFKSRLHRGRVLLRKHLEEYLSLTRTRGGPHVRHTLGFPIALAIIVAMLLFTSAYAVSANAVANNRSHTLKVSHTGFVISTGQGSATSDGSKTYSWYERRSRRLTAPLAPGGRWPLTTPHVGG